MDSELNLTVTGRIGPDLKVWWIPQVPMAARFEVRVNSFVEAKVLVQTLAAYDAFRYEQNVKPD